MGVTPHYVVVGTSGPDHKKEFVIEVKVNERKIAEAKGKSKKEAQQAAAKKAIDVLNKELKA
ncbi:Ribonuclease 3 [compost metagenome]